MYLRLPRNKYHDSIKPYVDIRRCSGTFINPDCLKQKQTEEVYYKKLFLKIFNIDKKTPVLESLFNKETPTLVFSCECYKAFKKTYFEEHPRTAISVPFQNGEVYPIH